MSWVNTVLKTQVWRTCSWRISCRCMSMYPEQYMSPIYKKNFRNKNELNLTPLSHKPVKGALSTTSDTIFHGEVKRKMINYIKRNGNSFLSRNLLTKSFELIKRNQIEGLHLTPECNKVITDAEILLIQAVENCRPVLHLSSIKRGGVKYQVPVPLSKKKSYFLAMKWLLDAAQEKDRKISLPEKLAWEIIDAAHGQGRVIKKKEDLNRQCEGNRAYAHYRWG